MNFFKFAAFLGMSKNRHTLGRECRSLENQRFSDCTLSPPTPPLPLEIRIAMRISLIWCFFAAPVSEKTITDYFPLHIFQSIIDSRSLQTFLSSQLFFRENAVGLQYSIIKTLAAILSLALAPKGERLFYEQDAGRVRIPACDKGVLS